MNHRTALPLGTLEGGAPRRGRVRATALEGRRRLVSVAGTTARAIRGALWAREVLIAVTAYLVYFGVRGATEGDVHVARDHAAMVQHLEQSLRVFVEPTLQKAVLRFEWAVDLSNWVYVFGHWPVIAVVFVWLYRTKPQQYRELRTAFLISGAIGLVIFALFPVAPPRLAEMGLVDTVSERSSAYRVLQPPQLTNQFAAVPSLHVGWNLLIGIALVSASSRRLVRTLGVLSPVVMVSAVVLTANHYLFDAVAGASLALLGLVLSRALLRREWGPWQRHEATTSAEAAPSSARPPSMGDRSAPAASALVEIIPVEPALPAPDGWHYSPFDGSPTRCSPTDPRCAPARGTRVGAPAPDRERDRVLG